MTKLIDLRWLNRTYDPVVRATTSKENFAIKSKVERALCWMRSKL